jgi:hypothetical protein
VCACGGDRHDSHDRDGGDRITLASSLCTGTRLYGHSRVFGGSSPTGKSMAGTWQEHGKSIARTCNARAMFVPCSGHTPCHALALLSPCSCHARIRARQELGNNMARAWQEHGQSMARTWQEHGKNMERTWHEHGMFLPCSCPVLAMLLACSCYVLAMILPCS